VCRVASSLEDQKLWILPLSLSRSCGRLAGVIEACFQLLKRLQREGPDPYAVVIPVLILSRIPRRH
jgi:hypothetical protein